MPSILRPETNTAGEEVSARRVVKSATAFRTISEVAEELKLPAHVLRFWESKFPQLRPLKRGGGRRYYRPEDVTLLHHIRDCLYREGYTIRGVQKLLREGAFRGVPAPPPPDENSEIDPLLFPLEEAELDEPEPLGDEAMAEAGAEGGRARPVSRAALKTALEETRQELLAIRDLLASLRGDRE